MVRAFLVFLCLKSVEIFDFVIKADGTWLYQGTPVGRKKLVQLFATVLQKDNDGYWLITPSEKGKNNG